MIRISEAFNNVQRVYLDAAPLIYFTENRANYMEKMSYIFRLIYQEQVLIITSVITISECLTKPLELDDQATIAAYNELFETSYRMALVDVDREIARISATMRAAHDLRTPDSLHIATALREACNVFLTNDIRLKRITDLRVLVLDELELDSPNTNT